MKNKRFYNFRNDAELGMVLEINGPIESEKWFDDDVTPKDFRDKLDKCKGDITVLINSPGGDVFAGSEIYTALSSYAGGKVTACVMAIAASAASYIAMAADTVLISPSAFLMIHNAMGFGFGYAEDVRHVADALDEISDGIAGLYAQRTGLDRAEIRTMMDKETYLNADTAIKLGFADALMKRSGEEDPAEEEAEEETPAEEIPEETEEETPEETEEETPEETEEETEKTNQARAKLFAACIKAHQGHLQELFPEIERPAPENAPKTGSPERDRAAAALNLMIKAMEVR